MRVHYIPDLDRRPHSCSHACTYAKKKRSTYYAMKMQLDRRTSRRQTCDPGTHGDHICLVVTKIAKTFLDSKWNAHIILTTFVVVVGRYILGSIHTYVYIPNCSLEALPPATLKPHAPLRRSARRPAGELTAASPVCDKAAPSVARSLTLTRTPQGRCSGWER